MDIPWAALSMFALAGLSVVLILIILLQRGRGGGLAGAFGGAGGQSALGTRAGDVFTKITVVLAVSWILLACVDNFILKAQAERFEEVPGAGADGIGPADGDVPVLTTPEDDDAPVDAADLGLDLEGVADPELSTDADFDPPAADAEAAPAPAADGDAEPVAGASGS